MIRRSPGLGVERRGTIFERASTAFRIMGRGVGWSIVMGGELGEGSGCRVQRSNMSYLGGSGIRMGNCIPLVNGMMLFMASILTMDVLGGILGVVGNRIGSVSLGVVFSKLFMGK